MATNTATVTPATVAAGTATVLATGDTVDMGVSPVIPTADVLAAAVAAVDASKGANDSAGANLKSITLARFRFHADALKVAHAGKDVLPVNLKSAAQALVWRDATGDTKPVPAKDRTPGQTSLGQYLSKFAKVATDLAYGLDHLSTVSDVEDAVKEISEEEKKSRERADAILAAKHGREYSAWVDALPQDKRQALNTVRDLFADGNPGAEFAELFAAAIVAASGTAK